MNRRICVSVVSAVSALMVGGSAWAAELVDGPLTDTSQIRTATNSPFFPNQVDLVGVNFFYTNAQNDANTPGGAASGTVHGVGFDNIDLDSESGSPPPSGPFTLTQNQGGTMTAAWNFPLTTSQQDRQQSVTVTGADAAALQSVAGEIFYLGGANEHPNVTFTFSGLGASQPLYVQIIGGDSGWTGDIAVTANGTSVGTWNEVADANANTASLYAFDTTSDTSGNLALSLAALDHYSGVSGLIISTVPEPTTASLLALGALGLLRRRRR